MLPPQSTQPSRPPTCPSPVNGRHHAIVRQLLLWCQNAGWAAQQEAKLDARRRIDLLVDTPDDTIMVDVTVCSTKAKSWAGYSASEIKERVEIAKKRAYGRFVSKDEEAQVRLVTFFIDVWGSMSDNSWNLLRALAEANPEGPTAAKMAQKISALTVVWSGRCAHAAGLLRVWGANTGLSSFCTQGRGPNTAQTRNASSYKQDDNQDEAEAGDDPSGAAASEKKRVNIRMRREQGNEMIGEAEVGAAS